MSRRVARTLAVAALAAVAAGSSATAANKQVDAGKVFNMLESYLKLPSAERSHFTMAYYMHIGPQPLTAPVWLLADGKRTPLPLRADGKVERLPTLAELDHGKLEVGIDESSKINVTIGVEPLMPRTADLDAHELSAAIAQAATGAKKAAGIMALAMPKLEAVAFVGSGSGEIEFADGHRAPLPLVKGQPTYNPETQPNAKRIRLAKPPLKLDLD